MKSILLALSTALVCSSAFAAKTYQVTGPVLEVTDTKVVVQKGKEKWEVSRTAGTSVTGDLKVGSKATLTYTMEATSIEVKPEKK